MLGLSKKSLNYLQRALVILFSDKNLSPDRPHHHCHAVVGWYLKRVDQRRYPVLLEQVTDSVRHELAVRPVQDPQRQERTSIPAPVTSSTLPKSWSVLTSVLDDRILAPVSNRLTARQTVWIIAALLIITGLVLLFAFAGRELWYYLRNREALRKLISGWGTWAWLGIILLQALQIVFAPMPGSLLSFAGGYVLGVWPAIIWLMLGVLIGSTIDFLLARLLGRRLLRHLVPAEKLARLDSMIIHRGTFYIFLLLLIPNPLGDWIYYLAGLSPLPLPVFLVFVLIARFPSNLIEAILGSSAARFNWVGWAALAAVVLALSLLYYFNQRRIETIIERLATRNRREPTQPS